MNLKRKGFTLIELIIVTVMIFVMSGFMAKLWSGMEHMSASVRHNMAFTFQSRNILSHLRDDIRRSVKVSRTENSLLLLTQKIDDGRVQQVAYRMDGKELVRDVIRGGDVVQSVKTASMKDLFLEVSFLKEGMIRLEVRRRAGSRPLERKNHSLAAYVHPVGGIR
ncbi:MAG: type II secretion system protein [Candidatus Omnitrophica bacterium]|nr:type II secretion system protein [Candidatus Omnitrophota bacterium]